MPVWQWLADSAGFLLALVVVLVVLLVLRRRLISRHGGTFELSVRDAGRGTIEDGRGWVLGLARYRDDSLEWFRIFSPIPLPQRTWRRADLTIRSQREPSAAERYAVFEGSVVVCCRTPNGDLELAIGHRALTGLQSWLEAGPPGGARP